MRRLREGLARGAAVLVAGLMLAACQEGGLPTNAGGLSASSVRLSINADVVGAGRLMKVVASYARASAPNTAIVLDSALITLTGAETQLPVQIDIAACLADQARELPVGLTSEQAAVTCVLHVSLSLYDAGNQLLDHVDLAPIAVRPGQTASPPPVELGTAVGAVQLSVHSLTLNAIGAKRTLAATIRDTKGQVVPGVTATFSSTAPSVATVDSTTGVVTALRVGSALVIARDRDRADTATVIVQQVPASLTLSARTTTLVVYGDTVTVVAVTRDSLGTTIPVTAAPARLVSSDTSVLTIDATSVVETVSVGSASVIGTVAGLTASLPIQVAARSPASIGLWVGARTPVSGSVGSDVTLPITVDMGNAQGQNLASLSFDVSWDPVQYDLVATANGRFGASGSFFVNTARASSGVLSVSMFDTGGFSSGRPVVYVVTLRPKTSGTGTVSTSNVVAGDSGGRQIPSGTFIARAATIVTP